MKVLLTGAGGSVGFETLKELIRQHYDVIAFDLPKQRIKKRLKVYQKQATIVYGDLLDAPLVSSLVSKVDVIIHLAAVIPPLADQKPELARKVNFYGSQVLISAILNSENRPFLLYSSSVSVYGDRVQDYWITVEDPLNPSVGDYYAETKIAVEEMIRASGISYAIFRLTGIMGHPKTDPLMFHMPLDTKLEIASTIDTGYAFVEALKHLETLNHHIYNLGGGEKCRTTYRDFLVSMFQIYGLNVHYVKEIAFAKKNFHCGYFKDSHVLNDILHFQRDTLDTYYQRVNQETKRATRFFARLFSRPIIYFLQRKSEPLTARKHKNSLYERFFGKEEK